MDHNASSNVAEGKFLLSPWGIKISRIWSVTPCSVLTCSATAQSNFSQSEMNVDVKIILPTLNDVLGTSFLS